MQKQMSNMLEGLFVYMKLSLSNQMRYLYAQIKACQFASTGQLVLPSQKKCF